MNLQHSWLQLESLTRRNSGEEASASSYRAQAKILLRVDDGRHLTTTWAGSGIFVGGTDVSAFSPQFPSVDDFFSYPVLSCTVAVN